MQNASLSCLLANGESWARGRPMKFGRYLRDHIDADKGAKNYVDYHGLKEYIKVGRADVLALGRLAGGRGGGSS